MQRKSIGDYVWFGTCVRYLQDAGEGARIHEVPNARSGFILSNIESFFKQLAALDLQVTLRASDELTTMYMELSQTEQDATLTADQAARLAKAVTDIRRTLEAELRLSEAFVVSPKRLDVELLLGHVDQLLAPDVFAKLPLIAQQDLAEAGKCIAFERPTAAAFHTLRATEAVLRAFYCALVRRGRIKTLMWGSVVVDLRKRRSAKQHVILLNHLDNIRSSFRNPTAHPETFYDIQECQDLWSLCVDAINRMARILP